MKTVKEQAIEIIKIVLDNDNPDIAQSKIEEYLSKFRSPVSKVVSSMDTFSWLIDYKNNMVIDSKNEPYYTESEVLLMLGEFHSSIISAVSDNRAVELEGEFAEWVDSRYTQASKDGVWISIDELSAGNLNAPSISTSDLYSIFLKEKGITDKEIKK